MSRYSKIQCPPLVQVFSDLDINGDGFVTAQEVRAVLSHLHTPFARHAAGSSRKQLDQWISDRDHDGDGVCFSATVHYYAADIITVKITSNHAL